MASSARSPVTWEQTSRLVRETFALQQYAGGRSLREIAERSSSAVRSVLEKQEARRRDRGAAVILRRAELRLVRATISLDDGLHDRRAGVRGDEPPAGAQLAR
jgi:hypothetical protein